MIKYLVLIGALTTSPFVVAVSENSEIGLVKSVTSRYNGHHVVTFDFAIPDDLATQGIHGEPNCSVRHSAIIDANEPGANGIFSTALAALTSGKKVEIKVEGCRPYNPIEDPTGSAPKIRKLKIHH